MHLSLPSRSVSVASHGFPFTPICSICIPPLTFPPRPLLPPLGVSACGTRVPPGWAAPPRYPGWACLRSKRTRSSPSRARSRPVQRSKKQSLRTRRRRRRRRPQSEVEGRRRRSDLPSWWMRAPDLPCAAVLTGASALHFDASPFPLGSRVRGRANAHAPTSNCASAVPASWVRGLACVYSCVSFRAVTYTTPLANMGRCMRS